MEDLNCWQSKFISCPYSDQLINKIILLNKTTKDTVYVNEIKKAIYYAKKYHGIQKRESGEPYYTHPLAVADMVADFCFKTDILITSILHDSLEDTSLTKELIEYIFDTVIADQVQSLTRIKLKDNKKKYKINIAESIKLLWLHKNSNDLLLIKYFDRLHNMQTINAKSPEKINSVSLETAKYFLTLGAYLVSKNPNMLIIDNQITELCYKYVSREESCYNNLELLLVNDFQFCSLNN